MSYIIQSSKENKPNKYMCIGDEGVVSWPENPIYATIFKDYTEALIKANSTKACGVSILEINKVYTKEDKPAKERIGEPLNDKEYAFWLTIKALPTRESKTKEDLAAYILNEAEKDGLNLHDNFIYINREYKHLYDSNFKKINVLGYDIEVRGGSSEITFDVELPNCPFTDGDDKKLTLGASNGRYSSEYGNFLRNNEYFKEYPWDFRAYGTGKGFWAYYGGSCEQTTKYKVYNYLLSLLGIDMTKLSPTGVRRGDKEAIKYIVETLENNRKNIKDIQNRFEAWFDDVCEKVKPDLENIINYMMSGGNI